MEGRAPGVRQGFKMLLIAGKSQELFQKAAVWALTPNQLNESAVQALMYFKSLPGDSNMQTWWSTWERWWHTHSINWFPQQIIHTHTHIYIHVCVWIDILMTTYTPRSSALRRHVFLSKISATLQSMPKSPWCSVLSKKVRLAQTKYALNRTKLQGPFGVDWTSCGGLGQDQMAAHPFL